MKTMTQIQFGICFFAQFKSADKIGFKFICSLCEHTVRADEKMESGQLILDGVKLVELNQTQWWRGEGSVLNTIRAQDKMKFRGSHVEEG